MNKLFAQLVEQHAPKVNSHVMEGLATLYMKHCEEYIDRVFRSASESFPEGLKYEGFERCTPYEEFEEITKNRNNKRMYDLAKSDIYLLKYKFNYFGESIGDRYVYLPFVNDGGILRIGGSKYHITPILSDKVISPGFDSVFVRLLRNKLTFKRCLHTVVFNGVRETTNVIWSQIHKKQKDKKKVAITTRANSCIVHYLFAKYGFTKAFEKYCGFVPTAGMAEITESAYPPEEWIICESCQVKPKTFLGDYYVPTELRLAIPRTHWNAKVKSFVAGFYYVVDHFPNRFKPDYLNSRNLWMILLGHIVFSGNYGENKLYDDIDKHFNSVDDYVDNIIVEKLKEGGYNIQNFYDLLSLIIDIFNTFKMDTENSNLNVYGKSLEVLYYVLYDITERIFKVNFKLGKMASKKKSMFGEGQRLLIGDIQKAFSMNKLMGAIFKLSSGKIIAESVSYSGDHKYPKITSKITEQESTQGSRRGKSKRLALGPDKHLETSMIEAGSILFLSKSNPTPLNKINPYIKLDLATGTIIPNPQFTDLLETTQRMLKGKKSLPKQRPIEQ